MQVDLIAVLLQLAGLVTEAVAGLVDGANIGSRSVFQIYRVYFPIKLRIAALYQRCRRLTEKDDFDQILFGAGHQREAGQGGQQGNREQFAQQFHGRFPLP